MFVKANADGYALALYDLHKEEKHVSSTYENILSFYELLSNDKEVFSFFNSTKIGLEEKYKIADELVQENKSLKTFANFLKLLISKNNSSLLLQALSIYIRLVESELNILRAKLISAFEIDNQTKIKIIEKLENKYNKKIKLTTFIDKSLIFGFKIVIGNDIIEQNAKADLEKISSLINNKNGGLND
ncbi:ATP synthase F1 subunit delta [Mycoplasmopsis agalactiae]|uniref:ATP synthase F1 subunit delta n=1 Tax=Mycoplasmopsis agalactiae TaxID=2110 RepID=UPI001F491A9D|nr:ATP synthase F1 subunit delta [Mycoplasmopsis agalactiae]MCE6061622.1 ATP synthase F1 subunit delta [Mycoplasmopsis agalactiae]